MKRNKVFIMNKDIPVAELRDDNCFHRINKEVEAPIDLFGWRGNEEEVINEQMFQEWMKSRTFPPERCGYEELLEEMGLDRYDALSQAIITKGVMAQDSFWVKGI